MMGFPVRCPIQVRWGDMDALGHVNNAVFFTYLESGRAEYFARSGLFAHVGEGGHGPILAGIRCDFRAQVKYPDELVSCASITRLGNSSFTMVQRLVRAGSGETVADAEASCVWLDYGTGRSQPIPDEIRRAVRDFESNDDL